MARSDDIRKFLESGLLEQHALGQTSPSEATEVEHWIDSSQEVRDEWEAVQETLLGLAIDSAITPPASLGGDIMKAVGTETDNPQLRKQSGPKVNVRRMNRLIVAASIAAAVFLTFAITTWNRAEDYRDQMTLLQERVQQLEDELEGQQLQFASLQSELSVTSDPLTQKVILTGNDRAPELSLVAFWNTAESQSWLRIVNRPELPGDQCLQLWADVHGEMISLGIIPTEEDFIQLDFKVDAESLNVTIEPIGGSQNPTVSRLVASKTI